MAVAFDFDGTIADTDAIKLSVFASLFENLPESDEISAYNRMHRGIPRKTKFEHICAAILKTPTVEASVEAYLTSYEAALEKELFRAQLIPGFRAFAERLTCEKFIVSTAPVGEIGRQLSRLGIEDIFTAISGFPTTKREALRRIGTKYPVDVFFGDARADYEAALSVDVPFVGIASKTNTRAFEGLSVQVIEDYRDIEGLLRMMHLSGDRR